MSRRDVIPKASPRLRRGSLLAATATCAALFASPARGQPPPPRPSEGVVVPAQGVAITDDASAIAINPANLAFSPGFEARFTWIHTGSSSPSPTRGYAVDVGLPFWFLATGLRLDWMVPPLSAPAPFAGGGLINRSTWVRWNAAARLGDFAAIGNTLAWSHAETPQLHGFVSATTGLTLRPMRWLSAAVVARDWNSPTSDAGDEIAPSVDMGLAIRPLGGHRMLEIAGEASYRSDVDRWVPGAQVGVDIPYVGRFRGGMSLVDPANAQVVLSAGLEVNLDRYQVGGGALFGNHLTFGGTGFYATAALRSYRERPGIPSAGRVWRMRFESTPDVRQHTRLLRTLWTMADDPEVDGVLFELRAEPADSLAHAEELVDAVRLLRDAGKKVLCHLEDAGGRSLHVCSAADRIAINPAGGVRFAGVSSRYLYFGGLLKKLGVQADFVRIGAHKLAAEQFTLEESSEVGREDHQELVNEVSDTYLDMVSRGRGIDRAELARRIAGGPFIATEARAAGLVDALVYDDEIPRFVNESFGQDVSLIVHEKVDEARTHWHTPPKVAVVYLDGDMIDGNSQTIPLLGMRLAGSYTVAKALKQAREDPSVRAVVLRVETGGGSSLAADVILREATLTARAKPLVVSMGTKAASGGYYAAVAAREIYANRTTVTGSIGIFYGKVDVSGLLGKLGVGVETFRSTPRADAESFFRPFTDDERRVLGVKVKQFYDLFIGRVAEGRKMKVEVVHDLAQGKVWTGQQAHGRGLVDHVGGLRQALDQAARLGGLAPNPPITELPVEEVTLFQQVLRAAGVPGVEAQGWVPPPLEQLVQALAPLAVYDPHKPLARMELMVQGP